MTKKWAWISWALFWTALEPKSAWAWTPGTISNPLPLKFLPPDFCNPTVPPVFLLDPWLMPVQETLSLGRLVLDHPVRGYVLPERVLALSRVFARFVFYPGPARAAS